MAFENLVLPKNRLTFRLKIHYVHSMHTYLNKTEKHYNI